MRKTDSLSDPFHPAYGLTEEFRLQVIFSGLSPQEACKTFRIGRSTFYKWKAAYKLGRNTEFERREL